MKTTRIDDLIKEFDGLILSSSPWIGRFRSEIQFARGFIDILPENSDVWIPLLEIAIRHVVDSCRSAAVGEIEEAVKYAETMLEPIGRVAKKYNVHCVGHAHADMNWMWPWHETVSICHDTFQTVDRLMNEFPEFKFSQSQISTYSAMEQYVPELFDTITKRIGQGRWEPVASMWVEGDKNLASGEILCRHILYSKRYLREKFGIPFDAVCIDWEPDTFGHAYTLPGILNRGGITRYYHARTGPAKWLMWWVGPDGSRVLRFNGRSTYGGAIDPNQITRHFIDYVAETGLKDFMYVYGVGDHGGGPTRNDLLNVQNLSQWPVYPNVVLSTTDAYFSAVESADPNLPVHQGELNFVFEGCYTSQSGIKRANRVSENILVETEVVAAIAGLIGGFDYPHEEIASAWKKAMFNQFHDILPGSGINETYEYSQGLFQDIQAQCMSVKTRALRRIASAIDTSDAFDLAESDDSNSGPGLGAGAGDNSVMGGVSAYSAGNRDCEIMLIFNPLPFRRMEMVEAKIWNRDMPADRIIVDDDEGHRTVGQVLETGYYWGHTFTRILFPADIPAAGYRVYKIQVSDEPVVELKHQPAAGWQGINFIREPVEPLTLDDNVSMPAEGVMENRYLRVETDTSSGAIRSLIDKETGCELVAEGGLIGALELWNEVPHPMNSWEIGPISRSSIVMGGCPVDKATGSSFAMERDSSFGSMATLFTQSGPHRASIQVGHKIGNSRARLEVALSAGSRSVEFRVVLDWREFGNSDIGVPMLKAAFPLRLLNPKAYREIPFGSIECLTTGQEVPALTWINVSGKHMDTDHEYSVTLVNADKYGHSVTDNVPRLTLLRSTYDPDTTPEIGHHDIRFELHIDREKTMPGRLSRLGNAFNLPVSVMSIPAQRGEMPAHGSFVEVLSPNIIMTAFKHSEESNAVVVRLVEMNGEPTRARLRFPYSDLGATKIVEVDVLEQPIAESNVVIEGDVVAVDIPAYAFTSIMLINPSLWNCIES